MEFGICSISIVPLRSEPSERAEMVSQILFGETFEITSRQDQWWQVRLSFDSYEGWINEKQGSIIEIDYYEKLNTSSQAHAYELVQSATNNDTHMPIVIGSTLPEFDGMNFKLNGEKFIYSGQAINPEEATITAELLVKSAMKFMNAPYLWGGRSPFGIDCSGYTQVVFKLLGIKLPRDAYQQADKGKMISFIDEAVEGDLLPGRQGGLAA
ncbi:MAG: C40 family peptidase, partial [Bacteroidetes bacterium]|nr:C40 family peptidase [Bacteroidota bacterium]